MPTFQLNASLYCALQPINLLPWLRTSGAVPHYAIHSNLIIVTGVLFDMIQYIAWVADKNLDPDIYSVSSGTGVVQFNSDDLIKQINEKQHSDDMTQFLMKMEMNEFIQGRGILIRMCTLVHAEEVHQAKRQRKM